MLSGESGSRARLKRDTRPARLQGPAHRLSAAVNPVGMIICLAVLLLLPGAGRAEPGYAQDRRDMVESIARMHGRHPVPAAGSIDKQVLQALRRVPRHEFVPEEHTDKAYANRPLPIGHGQTISQPYIVALMTDLLQIEPTDTVFELGTGSGYQAAVLSHLAAEVHTLEIIPELAESAARRLDRLGYDNVHVSQGDGYHGLEQEAPFEAIIVTAAAGHIPPPLVRQLKEGGRMVIPVGQPFLTQQLTLVTKDSQGSLRIRHLLPVSFVPLTGGH